MYYIVNKQAIIRAEEKDFYGAESAVCVLSNAQWEQHAELKQSLNLQSEHSHIHLCKLESRKGYCLATFCVPSKSPEIESCKFSLYLLPKKIVFIDDSGYVKKRLQQFERYTHTDYTQERFLFDFLISLWEEDLFYLQGLEKQITFLEEEVLQNNCNNFNLRMLNLKKTISKFSRFYTQLSELGQELVENEMDLFDKEALILFNRFTDRAARLACETQMLREYSMQVQEVYQSEIGIRQNDVMRTLTVVTTIFLPLTLITGWYGMNFVNMHELNFEFGYLTIAAISGAIVAVCLYIFKKKKFW